MIVSRSPGRFLGIAVALLAGVVRMAMGQTITEITLPAHAYPWDVTVGADGTAWFTEAGAVGRISTGGSITKFPIPTPYVEATGIVAGPDGNLWFGAGDFDLGTASLIGRLTPEGLMTEFHLAGLSIPCDIAVGPDGNLWFTECNSGGNGIGRISTEGVITEFPIPTRDYPSAITAGPDGNLWFTEPIASRIGRITPAGIITEFPLAAGSGPNGITAGPDGNLWFAEPSGNKIGRITTAGVVAEFALPSAASGPIFITTGPDRRLWFTERSGNRIGRITTSGEITEFSLPIAGSEPFGIVAAPDGAIWFTEVAGNRIGRLELTPGVCNSLPAVVISAAATTCPYSTDGTASVADAGPGASYAWSLTNAVITAGAGTPQITYRAGPSGVVSISVTVTNAQGCTATGNRSVTIDSALSCPPPVGFYTVQPCRVTDTRRPDGPSGGPALASGASRRFAIAGQCSIPADATSVSVNVTITRPSEDGYLTLHPTGTPLPNVSTINYSEGQTRANNAILSLGAGGDLNVYCGQTSTSFTVDFIVDVNGYFK